jgi:hypothetical protein
MSTNEFLATYNAHIASYVLSVVYLLLFVPMWRYVNNPK